MDALACLAYLQDARRTGAWGEYLVQPTTENILLAEVLQELGYGVRAVRWSYEVEHERQAKRAVSLAIELPDGTLVEARTGTTGFQAIEQQDAKQSEARWVCSWVDPPATGPRLETAVRTQGIGQVTDDAYARQRARVLEILRPVVNLERATPIMGNGRTPPRL